MKMNRWSVGVVLWAILAAGICSGQVDTGVITGTLTDASGAVVAGITLTITNPATGMETKTLANDRGQFVRLR